MKLFLYIKLLQKKYSVTNSDILNELKHLNASESKGSLSHKLNGERKLSEKEFEVILNTLQCSGEERKEARRLYKIHCLGEAKYEEFMCMKAYIEDFVEYQIPFIYEENVPMSSSVEIQSEKMLNSYILALLKLADDKSEINILCQPDYRVLSSILIFLYATVKPNVRQAVCFNNSVKSENNTHNIRLTKTLNNLVARNYKHQVRYYYDDIDSHLNSFTLFPFMLTLGNMAVLITSDYKQGLFIKDANLVAGLNRRFEMIYAESDDLFEIIENDFEYMKQCVAFEEEGFTELFALQYHPCTILNGNASLAAAVIRDELPYKKAILDMYANRLAMYKDKEQCFIYCEDGMRDFLETGYTTDMSPEIFIPVPDVDRRNLADRMQRNRKNVVNRALPVVALDIPKELTIMCYDNNHIIVGYKHPDFLNNGFRLITKEGSIYQSMLNMLRYMRDEEDISLIF